MNLPFNKILEESFKKSTPGYLPSESFSLNILRVDLGENAFGPSRKIKDILKKNNVGVNLSRYPNLEITELEKALSKKFQLPRDNILVSCGTDELIALIARTCANPGERVTAVVPTFYRFLEWSRLNGLEVIKVNLHLQDRFEFTKKIVDKVITTSLNSKSKIVWLCNPNNPTGTILPLEDVLKIAKSLVESFIVIDEVFYEFLDTKNKQSALRLLKKVANIIVLRSFSKTYGLTNTRCSFLLSNKDTVDHLKSISSPFAVSGISAFLAKKALLDQHFLVDTASKINVLREAFIKQLSRLKNIELGSDSKINILLLRHKSKDLFLALKQNNIIAADFRKIEGLEGLGFVRITIRTKQENQKVIAVLKKIN